MKASVWCPAFELRSSKNSSRRSGVLKKETFRVSLLIVMEGHAFGLGTNSIRPKKYLPLTLSDEMHPKSMVERRWHSRRQ